MAIVLFDLNVNLLDVANIICQIFCIGILFVLDSGMIIPDKSYEAKRFQKLIVADAMYVILNIIWQIVDGRIFTYCIEIHYCVYTLISISQVYVAICYYRYLFYVITRKKQESKFLYLPGLVNILLCATSYWTGIFFTIDEKNNFVLGKDYYADVILVYFYLFLIAGVGIVKWKTSSSKATRKRASISSSLILAPVICIVLFFIFPNILCLHSFGITLSIASVFVRLQKQEVSSTMHRTEIVKENAILYRNTVLSKSLQFMVINLSNNKVEELTISKRPEISIHSVIQSGIIKENNYLEIVKVWSQNIIDLSKEEIYKIYDAEILKQHFNNGENKISTSFRVTKNNGEISWCNQDIIMAKNDITGDIIATITITDINDQMQQEEVNKYQQAIIEALAYGSPSYWIVDIDTEEFIDYKVENERHAGIIEQEGLGNTYSEFIGRIHAFMSDMIYDSDLVKYFTIDTIRLKLKDNEQYIAPVNLNYQKEGVYFQVSYTKLQLNGRNAFVLSTRDITENVEKERALRDEATQALEKAKRASEAKSSFLFNMSHDIRTPMNAILGFNDMAIKYIEEPEKALDALKKAKYSGEHMLSLINDILDIARIESGKMKLNIEIIDVKECFDRFDDMFGLAMKQKGITFKIINNTKTRFVYADHLRISQVMANLLSNAMKFTNSGGSVTVTANEVEVSQEDYVGFEFSIKDTGIGMSEDFQKRIFVPFERENSSTVSGVQGTGLGLAIVKNFVEMMGGTISVTSKLGEGSEFKIFFNSKIAPKQKIDQEEVITLSADFKDKKVLVVEDNALNREIVCDILEDEGFIVTSAENGAEAVKILSNSPSGNFDLILMDVQMPIMDGYTATKEIRALDDETKKNIPIIAMTANAFEEDRKQALSVGMNEHVTKPIDVEKLLHSISLFIK